MKTTVLTSFTALAATTGLAAAPSAAAASPAPRPNVLFVAFDDLRLNLGCYGDPVAITPNIDRLAARGTLFGRAYTQQAVCNPSRQSLLSGRRPDSIRVWDLKTLFRQTAPDVVPLPEHFKLNGYFVQSIGKIYHGMPGMNDPRSWSVPEQFEQVPKRDDYRLAENRKPTKGQKAAATEFVDAPDSEYPDGKVSFAAVKAIEQLAARGPDAPPFFLAVGIRKPHVPFTAPKRFWDMYDPTKIPSVERPAPPVDAPKLALHDSIELRGYTDMPDIGGDFSPGQIARLRHGYYAATSFADAQFGRVLDALDRSGLAKNTIIVFWSDHGYHLGEHGLWCKTTNYESDTRVPFIMVTPGDRPRGVRTDALVELLDIYPTLVELCGLPPREKLEGRSLVQNLGNPAAPGLDGARSQFPRPWPVGKKNPAHMGYAIRTATHRYIEWRKFGTLEVVARELYTYDGDQLFETENLAVRPENAALVRRMAAMLSRETP
jgi:iduronate 2-sulfatase